MKCIICGEKFYHQTYLDPADPCDCGQCISAEAANQMDEHELGEARERWRRECEREATRERVETLRHNLTTQKLEHTSASQLKAAALEALDLCERTLDDYEASL